MQQSDDRIATQAAQLDDTNGMNFLCERVASAERVVLMLDYDGTLAPFHVDRMQARPLPRVIDALRTLDSCSNVTVIIVSGRPVAEVQSLLEGLSHVSVIGSHGYERFTASAGMLNVPVTPEQRAALDAAYVYAADVLPGHRVERKAASVAAHFRGLETSEYERVAGEIRSGWKSYPASSATELRAFNGGLELRAIGRSKGTAVHEVLAGAPQGTLAVYIGDDDTDEDAFAALPPGAIGIKVGPAGVETRAPYRLRDCGDVEHLLIMLSERKDGE